MPSQGQRVILIYSRTGGSKPKMSPQYNAYPAEFYETAWVSTKEYPSIRCICEVLKYGPSHSTGDFWQPLAIQIASHRDKENILVKIY